MQLIQSRKWSQSGIAAHPPGVLQEALGLTLLLCMEHLIPERERRSDTRKYYFVVDVAGSAEFNVANTEYTLGSGLFYTDIPDTLQADVSLLL